MTTEKLTSVPLPLTARGPAATSGARISVIEPRRPGFLNAAHELWRYRPFTWYFGGQLLRKRYRSTWLGFVWLPLRPTLNVGLKLLVFGGLVGLSAGGKVPYAVFFLFASAAWQLFNEALFWAVRSLYVSRTTLRTVHIPRLSVIVSSVIPSLVDFGMSIVLALAALGYYLVRAHILYLNLTWRSPIYITAGLASLVLLGLGLGLLGAVAGARARDVRFMLGYILNFLYYLTPIIYPFSSIPNAAKPFAELNPLVGAVELFKVGLFPGEQVSGNALLVTAIALVIVCGPALWLFQRQELREW